MKNDSTIVTNDVDGESVSQKTFDLYIAIWLSRENDDEEVRKDEAMEY